MSDIYGVMRIEKYKRSAVFGIEQERKRAEGKDFAYSDIDPTRTEYNLSYKETENWNKEITRQLKENGIKPRKDSVVMIGGLFTASQDFFTRNPNYVEPPDNNQPDERTDNQKELWLRDEKTLKFFNDCLKVYIQLYCGGDKSLVISAKIDMDEDTPHLQVYSLPLLKRENEHGEMVVTLSAKQLVGNRGDLRRAQDYFHENVGKCRNMSRGEMVDWDMKPEDRKKHKSTMKHKREMIRAAEQELQDIKKSCEEYLQAFENQIQEAKRRGSAEVAQMEETIKAYRQEYATACNNIDLLRELNQKINKTIKATKPKPISRLKEYPEQKNLLGKVTRPATTLVETESLNEHENARQLTPSDTWAIDRLERDLKGILDKLDGSEAEALRKALRDAQESERTARIQSRTISQENTDLRLGMENLIQELRNDPTVGYSTVQKIENKVQNILDGIEEEQTHSHRHRF